MIMQFLGIIDLLISLNIGLMIYGIYLKLIILIAGIYLIIKGLIFLSSLASVIDIITGILLIAGYFFIIPKFLLIIITLILLQKGIFSLF
ncbi:MAG: hypothetical protein QW041_01190 [Candidatus Pacearchaeota archaeon]